MPEVDSHLSILLVSQDHNMADEVSAALAGTQHVSLLAVCDDLAALAHQLNTGPARVVLLDAESVSLQGLSEAQGIISRYYDSRFLVLSEDPDADMLKTAMEVGVRYCVTKSEMGEELPGILDRLRHNGTAANWGGIVSSVLSGGGGCGATTIAVNLASELHLSSGKPVLLIDLDYAYGTLGTYLGLKGEYSVADLLSRPGEVDHSLIQSVAQNYNSGLDVLLSPACAGGDGRPMTITPEELAQVVEACKNAYSFCVIDAPRMPVDLAATLGHASEKVFVVFQLQIKDLGIARGINRSLTHDHGVAGDRIVPVANRCRSRRSGPMLTVPDAQEAFGKTPIQCVDNDFNSAVSAINFGKPLSETAPRSHLRKNVQELAELVLSCERSAALTGEA